MIKTDYLLFSFIKWHNNREMNIFFHMNHNLFLENLLTSCNVLKINTPIKRKKPKETN